MVGYRAKFALLVLGEGEEGHGKDEREEFSGALEEEIGSYLTPNLSDDFSEQNSFLRTVI